MRACPNGQLPRPASKAVPPPPASPGSSAHRTRPGCVGRGRSPAAQTGRRGRWCGSRSAQSGACLPRWGGEGGAAEISASCERSCKGAVVAQDVSSQAVAPPAALPLPPAPLPHQPLTLLLSEARHHAHHRLVAPAAHVQPAACALCIASSQTCVAAAGQRWHAVASNTAPAPEVGCQSGFSASTHRLRSSARAAALPSTTFSEV